MFAASALTALLLAADPTLVVKGQGHFPVALRLQDGRIAVVLRGGAPHLGIGGRLDVVFSSDEGKTWSPPTTVVDTPADDRNPSFGQASDGTLVVGFWRTTRYDASDKWAPHLTDKLVDTRVTRSSDGGKTWSEPAPIDVSAIGWGSPYGRMVVLPGGPLLMPVYGGEKGVAGKSKDCSYVFRSDDEGKTWRLFGRIGGPGFNETSIAMLPNGKMIAALRTSGTKGDGLSYAESYDEGRNWTAPTPIFPAMVHPADIAFDRRNRPVLAVGNRNAPYGVHAFAGAWSRGGAKPVVLVDDATNRDCGYPSTVALKDGQMLTVYYAVGSKRHPEWGTHAAAVVWKP